MPQIDLRYYVQHEGGGWSRALDVNDYTWTSGWIAPQRLTPAWPGGLSDVRQWYANERAGGRAAYYDRLESAWLRRPSSIGPVIVAIRPDGTIDIGDGWHRTAIAILRRMPKIPVIVGRVKRRASKRSRVTPAN